MALCFLTDECSFLANLCTCFLFIPGDPLCLTVASSRGYCLRLELYTFLIESMGSRVPFPYNPEIRDLSPSTAYLFEPQRVSCPSSAYPFEPQIESFSWRGIIWSIIVVSKPGRQSRQERNWRLTFAAGFSLSNLSLIVVLLIHSLVGQWVIYGSRVAFGYSLRLIKKFSQWVCVWGSW